MPQECWSPDSEIGLFLRTPLLDELHSLKQLLLGPADASRLDHGMASPRQAPLETIHFSYTISVKD